MFPIRQKSIAMLVFRDDNIKNMVSNVLVAKQTQLSCWESVTTTTVSQLKSERQWRIPKQRTWWIPQESRQSWTTKLVVYFESLFGKQIQQRFHSSNWPWFNVVSTVCSRPLIPQFCSFSGSHSNSFDLFGRIRFWLRTWLREDEWSCG